MSDDPGSRELLLSLVMGATDTVAEPVLLFYGGRPCKMAHALQELGAPAREGTRELVLAQEYIVHLAQSMKFGYWTRSILRHTQPFAAGWLHRGPAREHCSQAMLAGDTHRD